MYNLSVEEDNTYEVNNIIVHNCGAFSSNGGEDFRTVLEEFCKIKEPDVSVPKPAKWTKAGEIVGDDFSIAYRTFDAQYWGVPQRRKRIYLVADFDGGCASKILFESEGLSGYSAESFRAWQAASRSAENGSGASGTVCMCDQGGERIDILTDKTSTLRAEAHHPPCVMESAGFCTEHSAKARGIGYEKETSPTLRAGVVPAAIAIENHPADSRLKIADGDICQTLTSRCGTGGGNVPLLLDTPKAYGICSKHSNSMMSDNPNSGFYEAETSRTVDTSGTNPSSNQGGIVVLEGNGSRPSHHGDGYKESNTMYCLNCTENHGVAYKNEVHCIDQGGGKSSCCFYENQSPTLTCTHGGEPAVSYGIGRPAMNQSFKAKFSFQIEEEKSPTIVASGAGGVSHPKYSTNKSSHHTVAEKEKAGTLVASDYKDPPTVSDSTAEIEYIVRRLTPQES